MNLPSDKCSRCGKIETWSHVVQCEALKDENARFINTIKTESNSEY